MSPWLGQGVARYLVKHYFWVCLWRGFQKRLTLEFIDWVKQIWVGITQLMRAEQNKEPTCNGGDLGSNPWVGKISWRRAWQPTSVFLPGESPWTEEPGRLQSIGSQRVGHDWATKHSTAQRRLKTGVRNNSLSLPDCMSLDTYLMPLDWDLYHWFSWFLTPLGSEWNYTPGFLGSPA